MVHRSTSFLKGFFLIVTNGRGLDILPRPKNNETVKKLGLTKKNIEDIILALTEDNYYKGPKQDDRNPNQQIWEFGKEIDGIEVYIKLSIATVNKIQIAKCISFHEAEYPLSYPVKQTKGKIS